MPEAHLDQVPVEAAESAGDSARGDRLVIGGVVLACALWVIGVWGAQPRQMDDLGLLSVLRPPAFVALGILLAVFVAQLPRADTPGWRYVLPLVAFLVMVHGTPTVLYGTLRYSWAWKHLGIVDYIHRHGRVDPHLATLGVYHNWPGFFALVSAVTDLIGLRSAMVVARWWPVFANLAAIPVLSHLYSSLTPDRRLRWVAVWLFFLANWIGQDYFSPQSLAYLLYLVIIGTVLHRFRRNGPNAGAPAVGVVLLAAGAVVSSHQITPFMLVVALVALTVTRQTKTVLLTGAVMAMNLLWVATAARPFLASQMTWLVGSVGHPVANADQNLVDQARLSPDQVLVSTMGRIVVAAICVAAGVWLLRELVRRQVEVAPLVLAMSPVMLVFANSFDGEIVFRAYLFSLPFLAYFAAHTVWPPRAVPGRRGTRLRLAWAGLLAALLCSGFLFGYFGKERWFYFSQDEVRAATVVMGHGPDRSLLITANSNYPVQFENYERFTYVPIAFEPDASRRKVVADPAKVLASWMADPRYQAAYVLITRGQKADPETQSRLPAGELDRIERALLASPRFRTVFRTPDATVFVLANRSGS